MSTSIGKKALMALSGLLLVGFLFAHLAGNLTLFVSDEAFDAYAHTIKSYGPLVYVAEAGLLVLFACHIAMGLRVSMENRAARAKGYVMRNTRGKSTVSSTSMLLTGLVVLAFLIKHLLDFRFQAAAFHERPAGMVHDLFASPGHTLVYMAGVTALGIHLLHAFRSAFQSLGVEHPKLTPLLELLSVGIGVGLWAGFMSFPVIFWISS